MDYDLAARYYDRYVKWDTDMPFFLKETAKTGGEVLELMSGTGRLSLPLIEAGVKLTCVDSSAAMFRRLREKLEKRGLTVNVIEQNVCALDLGKQYDLILLPFQSFAELVSPSDQKSALKAIFKHLSENGRFICTLHNPVIRLKSVGNQLRLISRSAAEAGLPTLLVWSADTYNPQNHIVEGVQIFEEYDTEGKMLSRHIMDIKFCLHDKTQFEKLVKAEGFMVVNVYGDYAYSGFKEESSPVMIFELKS